MGIKGLNSLIKKYAPGAIKSCELKDFANKTLAVDGFGLLFAYVVVANSQPSSYIPKLMDFCQRFRQEKIDLFLVLDNKNSIQSQNKVDKSAAAKSRNNRKISATNRLTDRKGLLDTAKLNHEQFTSTNNVNDLTVNQQEKLASLLCEIETHEESIAKVEKQLIAITQEDIDNMTIIFQAYGYGVGIAEHEGEAGAVRMVESGAADIVVSNDTDSICFGDVQVIQNLSISSSHNMKLVDAAKVREEMGFTREEFIDFCILCGCDFSEKLTGLASAGAYNAIKTHRTIEEVIKNCPKYKIPETGWTPDTARYTFLSMPCGVTILEPEKDKSKLAALLEKYNVPRLPLSEQDEQAVQKAVAERKYAFKQPGILDYLKTTSSSSSPPSPDPLQEPKKE